MLLLQLSVYVLLDETRKWNLWLLSLCIRLHLLNVCLLLHTALLIILSLVSQALCNFCLAQSDVLSLANLLHCYIFRHHVIVCGKAAFFH